MSSFFCLTHNFLFTFHTLSHALPQASLITEYAGVVQPIQLAFQQQIAALKTQHEEFVSSLKQQQQQQQLQPAPVAQLPTPAESEKAPPMTAQAGKRRCTLPLSHMQA